MNESRLRPVTDMAAAAWVEAGAEEEFDWTVSALIPGEFESYARILHPADSPAGTPVRWAEVAGWSGRTIRPSVSFRDLARPAHDAGTTSAPWDEAPLEGELLPSQLQALCEVLAGHTGTPERCWFCLWDGWGWIDGVETAGVPSDFSREVLDGPRVRRPDREYLLLEGPLDGALELGHHGDGFFFPQSPNLFWPDDRSWCAATEIDLDSTYVGGSAWLIREVLDDSRIEAVPVEAADPIG
jgi:hypothetical protein